MKNSNTKAHYVTDSKLHQIERHCDLFKTIVVLNTVPGNNINIKEIILNYDFINQELFSCQSFTKSWW